MRALIFACAAALVLGEVRAQPAAWQPARGHPQVPIWPGAAPDAQPVAGPERAQTIGGKSQVAGRPWTAVTNVSQPTLTVYSPAGKNTGVAVVVFPGGGYLELAIDLEGTEVCDWLTAHGITAVLLKYRVPRSGQYWDHALQREIDPLWRWKMRKGPWAWCVFTRRSGTSIRIRSGCWAFPPAAIWSPR